MAPTRIAVRDALLALSAEDWREYRTYNLSPDARKICEGIDQRTEAIRRLVEHYDTSLRGLHLLKHWIQRPYEAQARVGVQIAGLLEAITKKTPSPGVLAKAFLTAAPEGTYAATTAHDPAPLLVKLLGSLNASDGPPPVLVFAALLGTNEALTWANLEAGTLGIAPEDLRPAPPDQHDPPVLTIVVGRMGAPTIPWLFWNDPPWQLASRRGFGASQPSIEDRVWVEQSILFAEQITEMEVAIEFVLPLSEISAAVEREFEFDQDRLGTVRAVTVRTQKRFKHGAHRARIRAAWQAADTNEAATFQTLPADMPEARRHLNTKPLVSCFDHPPPDSLLRLATGSKGSPVLVWPRHGAVADWSELADSAVCSLPDHWKDTRDVNQDDPHCLSQRAVLLWDEPTRSQPLGLAEPPPQDDE